MVAGEVQTTKNSGSEQETTENNYTVNSKLPEHGGVAGLNFYPPFLNTDPVDKVSRIETMCEHVKRLVNVGGIECVGIGTDFDGIEGKFEIADCTDMKKLFDALQKTGFSEDALEKIAYKNVERVIREVM